MSKGPSMNSGMMPLITPNTSAPAEIGQYNPSDLYGDVLTVLMARYENNLQTKHADLTAQAAEAKTAYEDFVEDFHRQIRTMASAYCSETELGIFNTTIYVPEYNPRLDSYNPIEQSWEKSIVSVAFQYTVLVDNTDGYNAEKQHYKDRYAYDYHTSARISNRIKKIFPIEKDICEEALRLMAAHVKLAQDVYSIDCLRSQLPSKERQLKAVVAEKKLEAYGLSDMLTDPQLASMISLDDELSKLVDVR